MCTCICVYIYIYLSLSLSLSRSLSLSVGVRRLPLSTSDTWRGTSQQPICLLLVLWPHGRKSRLRKRQGERPTSRQALSGTIKRPKADIQGKNLTIESLSEPWKNDRVWDIQETAYRSIQINYRQTPFLGGINFQLQIQNRAARRINYHYREISGNFSRKSLITGTDSLLNSNYDFHYRYRHRGQNKWILCSCRLQQYFE